jgi:LEA14-like dessication related protein
MLLGNVTEVRMKMLVRGTALVLLTAALGGCALFGDKVKAPNLQVAGIKYSGTGLTGAKLNVTFNVRNVNPTPLVIESFRYDLTLNGEKLGSGYFPTRLELAGMAEQKVSSVFDLSFLKVPAAVQTIIQQEHVLAHISGKFFLAGGHTMSFSSQADVSMEK